MAVVNICEKYIRTIMSAEETMTSPVQGAFDSFDDLERHMKDLEEWIENFTKSTLKAEYI